MTFVCFSELGRSGGLGNMLFQIAATIGIAQENGMDYKFNSWEYDNYFASSLPKLTISDLMDLERIKLYHEPEFSFNMPRLDNKYNWELSGYFQSIKYFEHCQTLVKKYFDPGKDHLEILKNRYRLIFEEDHTCFVHVRRGDYLELVDHHPVQPLTYFEAAFKEVSKAKYFIFFSDDIRWCEKTFGNVSYHLFVHDIPLYDLLLMSYCKNGIMSNSSFSWWGAYLNENKDKIIAPKRWFGNKLAEHKTSDLYLKDWILK